MFAVVLRRILLTRKLLLEEVAHNVLREFRQAAALPGVVGEGTAGLVLVVPVAEIQKILCRTSKNYAKSSVLGLTLES